MHNDIKIVLNISRPQAERIQLIIGNTTFLDEVVFHFHLKTLFTQSKAFHAFSVKHLHVVYGIRGEFEQQKYI